MSKRGVLLLVLLGGCAADVATTDAIYDDELDVSGKTDTTPLLTCRQVEARSEARMRGTVEIYDEGATTERPEGLSWGLDEWVIGAGFPLRRYRLKGELSVNRRRYAAVDELYWGNLYDKGGHAFSNHDQAYEMSVSSDGQPRITVRISESPATDVAVRLECEGELPNEHDARGEDPLGLQLKFACTTTAVEGHRAERFSFGMVRIDRLESIGMMSVGEEEEDLVVEAGERSIFQTLNENWGVRRNTRSIYMTGDSDGFAYGKLRLSIPSAAGDVVTGRYDYEADGEDPVRLDVRCETTAP